MVSGGAVLAAGQVRPALLGLLLGRLNDTFRLCFSSGMMATTGNRVGEASFHDGDPLNQLRDALHEQESKAERYQKL